MKAHVYLTNEKKKVKGFKKTRNVGGGKDEDEIEISKLPNPVHQRRLHNAEIKYNSEKLKRENERKIEVSEHIDLITIHFYKRFEKDLQNKFVSNYGLSVVSYSNFNKSVLFTIDDLKLFIIFKKHLSQFYNSSPKVSWSQTEYNLIALIHDFEFHSTQKIVQSIGETQSLFHLIDIYDEKSSIIQASLFDYFVTKLKEYKHYSEVNLVEIKNINKYEIEALASSFDIIKAITSARTERIKPSIYGTVIRDFGFETISDSSNIKVGIIDTGVSRIDPLKNIISNNSIDITNTVSSWDEAGHGTLVAGIVAFGEAFYTSLSEYYEAHAKIFPIKAIHSSNDNISIIDIVNAIKEANEIYGVRIFNLSLNEPFAKEYNTTFSDYAYLLDKLAYENDILIFISAGNVDSQYLKELQEEVNPLHNYPNHFNNDSDVHLSQNTNIATPADSLNNITVGALAGNFENKAEFGITPAKELPAIYSRKFHYDFSKDVNGTKFINSQKNKYLNKPDLVHFGGDLFEFEAGIEVLRSPLNDTEKYYTRTCGTSLATPLVTNIAAQILKKYPTLKTQTVKALLINSANKPWGTDKTIRDPKLMQKLTGFGMPESDVAINSSDDKITFIIEDFIRFDDFKTIELILPKYINETKNKLNIVATLCYSFKPVKDNHLAYCPLQITFGCFKNTEAIDLANNNLSENQISSTITWSEDFFGVENRIYSNSQKIDFNLSSDRINKINNRLTIAIKCTGKSEINDSDLKHLKESDHPFSIVFSIEEIAPKGKNTGLLYQVMIADNNIEAIGTLDDELTLDL